MVGTGRRKSNAREIASRFSVAGNWLTTPGAQWPPPTRAGEHGKNTGTDHTDVTTVTHLPARDGPTGRQDRRTTTQPRRTLTTPTLPKLGIQIERTGSPAGPSRMFVSAMRIAGENLYFRHSINEGDASASHSRTGKWESPIGDNFRASPPAGAICKPDEQNVVYTPHLLAPRCAGRLLRFVRA